MNPYAASCAAHQPGWRNLPQRGPSRLEFVLIRVIRVKPLVFLFSFRTDSELICEQFLESLAGLVFTRSILGRTHILAPDKLEVFAVIGEVLFRDGVCAPIPALLGHTRSVTDAIQADL